MTQQIRKGAEVEWVWGSSKARGKVVAIHRDSIERTINGSRIARNGTDDDPALEIEQDDGATVLKLRSEVSHA